MRRLFNEAELWEQAESGELHVRLRKDGHPSRPRSGDPFCTRSQILEYWRDEERVAVVHQFLKPDGTIGASGRPDPRVVRRGRIEYRIPPEVSTGD
jgi:hypothetical protein